MCVGAVTTSQSASNHMHVLNLSVSQINVVSGTSSHNVTSADGHIHTVMLTAAERAILRTGMSVTKTSSLNSGHTHNYTIACTGS